MIVGPTKVLFMDEISTGLDSSTTFSIVKSLSRFSHAMSGTVLVSLLQPAPETFALFDDVLLLSEGQVVYHGPIGNVMEFFESCGFKLPDRKGIADFLQEVTSRKDQEQYWADKSRPYHFISVREFSEAFRHFHVGVKLYEDLAEPYPKDKSHPAALAMNRYSIPKLELLKIYFRRERVLQKRNAVVLIVKAVQVSKCCSGCTKR
jgi:ABC-type multidrug transport system ATPase subunit